MAVTDLLLRGLELLVLGMGIVYAFLLVLVGTLVLMARLVRRIEGDRPVAALVGGAAEEAGEGTEVVAAIAAAITLHRALHAGRRGV